MVLSPSLIFSFSLGEGQSLVLGTRISIAAGAFITSTKMIGGGGVSFVLKVVFGRVGMIEIRGSVVVLVVCFPSPLSLDFLAWSKRAAILWTLHPR